MDLIKDKKRKRKTTVYFNFIIIKCSTNIVMILSFITITIKREIYIIINMCINIPNRHGLFQEINSMIKNQ